MPDSCPICGGSGLKLKIRSDGERYAEECACHLQVRASRLLSRAAIPKRYEHCTLESFTADYRGANRSLSAALMMAHKFVAGYPVETEGKGLLLTGSVGVGKTHLSVGILQALIRDKGVRGLFCDYRELLKRIQESYNPRVSTTELQILGPVFEAEVLVLDELGAQKPTDWVWDTVALLLNTRYNDKLTTLITTNYSNLAAGASKDGNSLGDRIGDRMRSRLFEMCVEVRIAGDDFRERVNKARFG